jgi:hypothetical protein
MKASLFMVRQLLTSDLCKDLVFNLYENEPPLDYDLDTVRSLNENKRCSDAAALNKWAVLEFFCLGDLADHNCYGRSLSTGNDIKLPLDTMKPKYIKESVLQIYPQCSDGVRIDMWCYE